MLFCDNKYTMATHQSFVLTWITFKTSYLFLMPILDMLLV